MVYVGGYALNTRTGALLWTYPAGSSTAAADGVIYVGSNNNVYALNACTGTQLWNFTAGDPVLSSPAVANEVVMLAQDGSV